MSYIKFIAFYFNIKNLKLFVFILLKLLEMFFFSTDNLEGKIVLDLKEVTKNGKKHIYVSKANTNLNVKTFKYDFDESEKEMSQLHEALNNIVNENEQDIINKVKPALEKKVSETVISIINYVIYDRYEQLFPDEA